MSYAIAPTFEGNRLGIRRLRTLSGAGLMLGGLGDAGGTASVLISQGWDSGTINTLLALGATDQQLTDLLNGATDVPTLMGQLTGTQAPYSPTSPQNPVMNATISTVYGAYDLTQQASWNAINSLFTNTQQQLTALARQLPNDPDVLSHVSDFNSKVTQWAGYYQQAFGSAPSPMPIVTLSGLGVAPIIVGAAVIAGVAVLVYFLYTMNQWIATKKAAVGVTAQQTQNQATLLAQYQAAVAAGNTQLASQILTSINQLAPNPSGQSFTTWMSQNWGIVAAGGFAFLFLGIFAEKRL
ncbi:MAG: hypothetical protein LAO08_20120 [Acidobacteriia bacterium]|nr:hypothetical protein [Terriglobia bacterium]